METINITCRAHVTPEFLLKSADAQISKLKRELGESKSYIEELEYKISELEKGNDSRIKELENKINELVIYSDRLKLNNTKLNNKYSQDVQMELKKDELYKRAIEKINSVQQHCRDITTYNKKLLEELIKLRNERDNSEMV